MDKLRSMEIFVATVDDGSFTAAAARFDISAVMVGKHIAFLEQRLGARLLTRTTRRQSLTEIGEQYLEQCRVILAQIRDAESGAEAMRLTPRGRLRISAPVTFGSEAMSPHLPAYLQAHPEVSLDLELNDRLVDLVEDGFDAAIRIGELDDSGLVARKLRPYRMMICAAPSYLARHGTPLKPADLEGHECIDFTHWKKLVRWRLRGDGDASAIKSSRFRANNGQSLKQAALAGFGVVLQAELMLIDEVRAGRLVPLLEDYVPEPRPMHLLYPRDRQATPKLTTFVDFMMAQFGAA
jgi:DNA-binding transcriptional LysR family regulator